MCVCVCVCVCGSLCVTNLSLTRNPSHTQRSLGYLNTFIERPGYEDRLLFWHAAALEAEHQNPTGWLYYAVDLWKPCTEPGCGGKHLPKVLERTTVGSLHYTAFTDFPPANFIWSPTYDDIFVNGDGQYWYPCADGVPCATIRIKNIR